MVYNLRITVTNSNLAELSSTVQYFEQTFTTNILNASGRKSDKSFICGIVYQTYTDLVVSITSLETKYDQRIDWSFNFQDE